MQEQLTGADYTYSTKMGSVIGFLAGWALGIAMLIYIGSSELNNWPGVESISILPRSFPMFCFTTSMPTPRPDMSVIFSAVENPAAKMSS